MKQKAKDVLLVLFKMPFKVDTYWNNKLASNPNIKHCYYRITEVPHIPNVPGIYSWHLWIDNANNKKYSQIFKQKRIDITVESNLSEKFIGAIKHSGHQEDIFDSTIDINLCNIASIAMCPPLYIGISKNLGVRLGQHFDEFDKIIKGIKATPIDTIKSSHFDTIYESQHFAQRMGFVISKFNNLNANNLLIKTIEMPIGYSKDDLRKVETFLNRTFIPIYGRK